MTEMTAASLTAHDALDLPQQDAPVRAREDMAMMRAASELTRDLTAPRPAIYWADFLVSAGLGYGAFAGAVTAQSSLGLIGWSSLAILALYRAGSFIHELTHIKHSAVPGFRTGWNLLLGIPMLIPSFMYESVHSLHHARTRYGTAEDPEYLPLALMKPWTLPLFVVAATLAPLALLFRYGILSPLSAIIPPLRSLVIARYSSFAINPAFRRRPAEGELKRFWLWAETLTSVWAMAIIAGTATGIIPVRIVGIALAIMSGTLLLNQIRTLVAHLWESDGSVMTATAQYLDSVNVPPPATLPALWAPVGLRYHAIHHLLPGLPYHALGEAHRRLSRSLEPDSSYHKGNYAGLPGLVARLVRSSMGR
jgi:fatty acid desaturase